MASSTTLKFSLKVGSLPANKFRVQEFTLNEAVSECFYLHVQASSEDANIAYAAMIGQAATLKVEGEDFPVTHHGVVTEFNQYPDHSESHGHESYLYDMIIEPRLKLLSYTSQNRIFLKQDAKDIVTKVLTDAGLGGTNIEFQVSGAPPKREYTVQYNETDSNFVQRLLEDEGIFYFFDHEGDKEKLIMADKVGAIRPVTHTPEVVYHPEAGLAHLATDHIMKVKRTQKMVTGKVTIKDYNSNTPEATVKGGAAKNGQGELYAFGPHVRTAADANRMATLRAEMLACGKTVLEGEGICRAFRPGFRFKLKEEAASHFGGDYLLTRVTHHGDQREGFEGDQAKLIFTNAFTCIPADTVFRPPLHTPKPRIHGVITARVTGNDTKYANVDEEGRYHAKLPFDLTDAKNDQASVPVRMAQPYGGPNYGVHFPLHNDNDMVLAFFDGDVDRPIGMGTVPNPSTSSPVNDRNKSESVIRTASGHQIRLDDKEDKTVIDITTHGKHVLSMNDDKDKQEIHFKTTDENEMVFDDKNKNIRIMTPKGAHLIKLDYDKKVLTAETKYGHKLTMDDEAKKIALQTKDGHILALDDDKKLITLQDGKGKHVFQIDVGGSVISITTTGDMEIAAKGKLNIEAKEITMEAKQGAFNVKAMKDIAMEGMNFNAKGKMKLALEGTTEASMKGLQTKIEGTATLDLKSTGQAKLSGLKASLEGQVMSEVKAAIVMIN